jgi:signal transduction histidine kinase
METLFGIVCRVEVAPDLPLLTNEQALQLYRIAQEAARNAVQHGKARNIEISVRHDPGQLIQTIRNDGQPWAPVKESGKSLGLRIMRYRAGTFGGTLAVQSDSSGQTVVACQMPLPRTDASDPAVDQPALPFL